MAPMYLMCVALIISIVNLCSMLLYKVSKSYAKCFGILGQFSSFFTTVNMGAKPVGFSQKMTD
jgi:hypothetical protein